MTHEQVPYFETVKSFAEVPITEKGIDTLEFLQAADGLVKMFDLFGSAVFGFVQTDMRNNIHGIRTRYSAAPDRSSTLELMVENEVKDCGRHHAFHHGVGCMIRLIRGLAFTHQALYQVQSSPNTTELHACFKRAYNDVLKKHHTFIVRGVVSLALLSVPHRKSFYDSLLQGSTNRSKLDDEMKKWLEGLEGIVKRMKTFLESGGYGRI
ncbi:hypothetical protein ONZ45_g12382 [Pleurotus djamor]|nr:hypothetical protein ONZ45_g12382 [Pleurotus djamor]